MRRRDDMIKLQTLNWESKRAVKFVRRKALKELCLRIARGRWGSRKRRHAVRRKKLDPTTEENF